MTAMISTRPVRRRKVVAFMTRSVHHIIDNFPGALIMWRYFQCPVPVIMEFAVYQACLFDYGNTLVEFDFAQIRFIQDGVLAELARRFGPVSAEALRQAMDRLYELPRLGPIPTYRELDSVEQMTILLEHLYGRVSRPREAVAAADEALQELFISAISIHPRDRALLARLSEKIPLGLVSNYPSGSAVRKSLRKIEIDDLFRVLVISGEVGFVKPHRSMFQPAIEALEIDPSRILFVGDRWDADLCGARDAGLGTCHMIGFTSETGFEERYASYRPDHVARSLGEVAAILGLER
jgi:HAD superfamily hydrolase (TIGR01549 family)